VTRIEETGTIRLRVALTSDIGAELDLTTGNAHALLEGLGLRPDNVGEIPIDTVRARLANPAVRRRAAEHGVTAYLDRLDQLLATAAADDTSRLDGHSLRPKPSMREGAPHRWRALFCLDGQSLNSRLRPPIFIGKGVATPFHGQRTRTSKPKTASKTQIQTANPNSQKTANPDPKRNMET